jgi:hypothetical protein
MSDDEIANLTLFLAQRARPGREPRTLRWILAHMVQEYARHNGHADLIRQSIDGQVGDR